MDYHNADQTLIYNLVRTTLITLYRKDSFIFERNNGDGVCERSIVFRFAYWLQRQIDDYFVDCDFNSSFEGYRDEQSNLIGRERHGKPIENNDGTVTKRFVDIIVHKRDYNSDNDFIVFECKKWNNNRRREREKDFNNLRVMTTRYGYKYGFHIIFGQTLESTKWTVFQNGDIIIDNQLVLNENGRRN